MLINGGLRALALCLGLLLVSHPALADSGEGPYLIEAGDVLEISVWQEENLQRVAAVRPDGRLSFPLVGDVPARGKSVEEVQAEITTRLQKFIPDPVVTVAVQQLSGNVIYVIGKVNRPGNVPVVRKVDVVQALAMAGGMTPYAAANKIHILRREDGHQSAIPFAYGDIEKGEKLEQNILLQAGDVVVVP